jgi:ribonuclease BN (tRNA processing enzyme)
VSGNGAFVYSGDSEYSESVVGLARGAHTFLAECCFPDDNPVPGHLIPSGVARIAREVGVGRIVLTHIYRLTDALDLEQEVGKGFDGEVVVAEDGTKLTV